MKSANRSQRADWSTVAPQILERLDIQAEYEGLGVKFTGRPATDKGWKACHAFGRDNRNASAAVNIGEGQARGRYRDMGGDGLSCSLFEFAGRHGGYGNWREARRFYAHKAGVALPSGSEPKNPIDALEFEQWNDNIVEVWCQLKGGITPEAVRLAGGRLARWPEKAPRERSNYVVAFPGFPLTLLDADPCACILYNQTGQSIRIYQGRDKAPEYRKIHTVGGSRGGLMNAHALAHLAGAAVVWKTEGVSDMLALQSIIPPERRDTHLVITNSGGCAETVRPEWATLLAGKDTRIIHDADQPGQVGAAKWVAALDTKASAVRNVQMPYEVAPKHGKDLRDWIREGHNYADLLALAEATKPVTPAKPKELPEDVEQELSRLEGVVAEGGVEALARDEKLLDALALLAVRTPPSFWVARDRLRDLGVPPDVLASAIQTRVERLRRELAAEMGGHNEPKYVVSGGCLCEVVEKEGEDDKLRALCNFEASIVEEVTLHDGDEVVGRSLAVEGRLRNGSPLPRYEVAIDAFAGMNWPIRAWGAQAVIYPGPLASDKVRANIQMLSSEPARVDVYAHAGWQKVDDEWLYLTAAGGIGPKGARGDVRVQLPEALRLFELPPAACGNRGSQRRAGGTRPD
jgi:hypothetical protein